MSSVFGFESTTDEVLEGQDLSGKRALVTGVSAGLGVETARTLAAHGAQVVGTARDLDKACKATQGIPNLELVEMDLASLASVRGAADSINAKGDRFDLVVLNAGVMACPEGKTVDGFETQFGTNHLGHFLLANRIAPLLNDGARVVSLSSVAHRFSDVSIDDPNFERSEYDPWVSYGRSKTANILFANEFDRRHQGRGIRATAIHPGGIATELSRHVTPETMAAIGKVRSDAGGAPPRRKSIPQGAATTVWAGVTADADAVGGRYCEDCHVAEVNDTTQAYNGVYSYAVDPERAKALWAKSEEMVGERFD